MNRNLVKVTFRKPWTKSHIKKITHWMTRTKSQIQNKKSRHESQGLNVMDQTSRTTESLSRKSRTESHVNKDKESRKENHGLKITDLSRTKQLRSESNGQKARHGNSRTEKDNQRLLEQKRTETCGHTHGVTGRRSQTEKHGQNVTD